jgi:parallel beta-helix repeat protein
MLRAVRRVTLAAALALGALAAAPARGQAADAPVPVLTADTQLDPAVVYGGLVIAKSGISVDGRGARLLGPVLRAAQAAGTPAAPRSFTGVGIKASGVDGVTLKNLRVQGFELGLLVEHGAGWHVSDCDLSDNFHDPDFGWGEQGERGGVVLRDVRGSELRRVRANRCWNGCSLVDCEDDGLLDCDFSHSSNVCLRLWHSSRNDVAGCDLSWGLRIAPGERHARDSTCVLLESGSDGNVLERNDCTHGGDGIFVRVLNQWPSTGNSFEGNDASWANNNGFEAWSPGNSYVGNRANHCSYGFWLGASEGTELRQNEAGWNGDPDGFHNAPEAFGHGGIVFVNGPSAHTTVILNHLHHNAGGGLVLRGDEASSGAAFKAFHWVVEDNLFEANRWGIWLRHADAIDLGPNQFRDDAEGDVHDAGDVSRLLRWERPVDEGVPAMPRRVQARLSAEPPGPWRPGQTVTLDASGSIAWGDGRDGLTASWILEDGSTASGLQLTRRFEGAGSFPIALTVHDDRPGSRSSSLAWLDALVVEPDELPATAGDAARWTLVGAAGAQDGASRAVFDEQPGLLGAALHAHVEPYDGGRVALLWPATRDARLPLAGRRRLALWMRALDPNIPAWQDGNPVLTLGDAAGRWLRWSPQRDLLADPPQARYRGAWMPLDVPLAGGEGWTREVSPQGAPDTADWLSVGLDSWGAPPLDVWLDGLALR